MLHAARWATPYPWNLLSLPDISMADSPAIAMERVPMRTSVLILALVALMGSVPAAAQIQSVRPTGAPIGNSLPKILIPNQLVRIQTLDGSRHTGITGPLTDGSLVLNSPNEVLRINVAEIERMWLRGHATRKGALIGGAIGLAGGVVYGLLITEPASSPCDANNCTRAGVTVLSGLLGAAVGAGSGAIIGSLIPRWSLRFP